MTKLSASKAQKRAQARSQVDTTSFEYEAVQAYHHRKQNVSRLRYPEGLHGIVVGQRARGRAASIAEQQSEQRDQEQKLYMQSVHNSTFPCSASATPAGMVSGSLSST